MHLLDNLLDKSWNLQEHATRLLLSFKLTLFKLNSQLSMIAKDNQANNTFDIYRNDPKYGLSICGQETKIILFISVWCIYIKQRDVRPADIKNNFNLINEYRLLRPTINLYLENDLSIYHFDAKKCKQFLIDCSKL